MAAEHALITAVANADSHMVIPDDLYGGTYRLVDKVLARWGIEYTMVDQTDVQAVADAVRPDTKLIWVETPTNPNLKTVDVAAVVGVKQNALVAVDNTFATPVYQQPLELGADAVVHSTTKYLGGHSDAVGGAVIVREESMHGAVRFVQNSVGAVPGPLDCFLVHRGLRTLHLRMAADGARGLRRALAGLLGDGVVPPSGGDAHRRGDEGLLAGRVAGRRRVAGRGSAGHDAPVGRGLRGGGGAGPRPALLRDRGAGGPRRRPGAGDRRLTDS
jgi:cystathionine gamma-synthase